MKTSGFTLPEKCPRGLSNCQPLGQVLSKDGGFICCGLNSPDERSESLDIYRHCWKNDSFDEMSDFDRRDVLDTVYVLVTALAIHENMEVSKQNGQDG